MTALLEATGLAKYYGAFAALDDVDFALGAGETVAIVGENGAGKSTLSKIFAGVVRPDAGEIAAVRSTSVGWRSPRGI